MIELRDVTKRFGDATVLSKINLKVEGGESIAIMGSSGGGKTTLLRCIAGLLPVTEGTILVDGTNVADEPDIIQRSMGMVFQSAALFDYLSVRDNVLFGLRRREGNAKQWLAKANGALEHVGLADDGDKMPSELSGGMRKRVGIARALALDPKVILFDEPTTGLDPITTFAIDELMFGLQRVSGVTTLIVSHDLTSVTRVVQRVAFLHAGEIVFDGTPADFMKSDHPAISELIQKVEARTL